jgi:hypothetical protein
MVLGYKALHVPISVLHSKVYAKGRRLEHMPLLEVPKKAEKTTFNSGIERVISPGARVSAQPLSCFDRCPYFRKFFVLDDGQNRTSCRVCKGISLSDSERHLHAQTCYAIGSKVLEELRKEKQCCICFADLDADEVHIKYNDVPVCGDSCLNTWDQWDCDPFTEALGKLTEPSQLAKIRALFLGL